MRCREGGSVDQPEENYTWVEGINREAGSAEFGEITLPETGADAGSFRSEFYFFEEDIVDAHRYQESTAYVTYRLFIFEHGGNPFRKSIT